MALSNIRVSSVSSSEIVSICGEGKAKDSVSVTFYTYIKKKRYEYYLKQKLESDVDAFNLAWGKLVENIVHKLLPTEYRFQSENTIPHPSILGWVGTPDGERFKEVLRKLIKISVTDIKCPATRLAFMDLIIELYDHNDVQAVPKNVVEMAKGVFAALVEDNDNSIINIIRNTASDGEKYYWQIVSNSCIENTPYGELIAYCPYFENLQRIIDYNISLKIPYNPVLYKKIEEMPHILKESGLLELNVIRFKISEKDKQFLEMRARMATEIIAMNRTDYNELIAKKDKHQEAVIIDFIKQKTGEEIKYFKKEAA